jgi:AcrR family transcriptional regulator
VTKRGSEGGRGGRGGRGRAERAAGRRGRAAERASADPRGGERERQAEAGDSYHHGDLRRALVQGGLTLLARDGLAAFSLRALAQELGVSHAAPYRHFSSREELLAQIVRESMARFEEALASSAFVEGDDEENLYRLGEAYVAFYLDNPEILALFSLAPGELAERGGALGRILKAAPMAEPGEGEPDLMEDRTFMMLRRAAAAFQGKYPGLSERDVLLGFWAKAHGLAALLVSQRDWFAPEDLRSGLARVIRKAF